MESIICHVRDIDPHEREVLEHVLGQPLRENQQVIFQIVTVGKESAQPRELPPPPCRLPDWCNVFEGLSEQELGTVEEILRQRADLARFSE